LFLQVGVLSPLGKNFYLNITPNNLVRLFLRADSVPEGSPTSVRVRELSSKDWEASTTDAANSLCNNKRLPNIQQPVANCTINGRMLTDCANATFQRRNFDTNPVQKQSQSLTEIVTSLRSRASVSIQASNRSALSVTSAPGNASVRSDFSLSSHGKLPQTDSSCRVQTGSLKLHDRPESQKDNSHPSNSCQASNLSEAQSMKTPGQLAGAKFRFKRTSTTPASSQIKSPIAVQPTSAPYSQCLAAPVTTTSTHHHGSLPSLAISTRVTAIGQSSNTTVDDMWDAGSRCAFIV